MKISVDIHHGPWPAASSPVLRQPHAGSAGVKPADSTDSECGHPTASRPREAGSRELPHFTRSHWPPDDNGQWHWGNAHRQTGVAMGACREDTSGARPVRVGIVRPDAVTPGLDGSGDAEALYLGGNGADGG